MTSVSKSVLFAALLVGSAAAPTAVGQVVTTPYAIAPGGAYTYFPSGFGGGISGCDPSNYQCDYAISGTFLFEENLGDGTATITNAELTLVGNEGLPPHGLTTDQSVEDWLESLLLESLPLVFPGRLYLPTSNAPGTDFSVALLGDEAIVTGGYNAQPIDGDSVLFDFTAQVIPEPSAVALLVLAGGITASRRR